MAVKPLQVDIPKGATYQSLLKKWSEEKPDKQAFVFIDKDFEKTILTRKDVWDKSRKFAAILRRHGIKKGDIVCNTLVNSPERVLTAVGTVVAGAISMHGQVFLEDGEDIIHNCRVAKCNTIIIDPNDTKGALPIFKRIQYTDDKTGEVRYTGLPDLTTVIDVIVCCHGNRVGSYKRGLQCLEEENEMFEESDINEEDMAFIFSTSGTTGFSKQVPYSHRNCFKNAKTIAALQGIESENCRSYSERSLGWLGGWPGGFLVSGATRILTDHAKGLPEKMGEHIMRILNDENIDCGVLLPGDIENIVKSINSGVKLQNRLRAFGIGGMPLTKRLLKYLGFLTDCINVVYGSTEIGLACTFRLEVGTVFEDYCGGFPVEGFEVKILGEDRINEVPTGKIGELAVRSSIAAPGYLNEPERTQDSYTEDGFFLTADCGYIDEKGCVYILGRMMSAIHSGVYVHYPGWIESRILKCPDVENVVVIGVPDPVNHQAICACIMTAHGSTMTEQYLKDYCQSLFLVDTKSDMSAVPKYFLFYDSFPRNANGKLDRKILVSDACKRLNIAEEGTTK